LAQASPLREMTWTRYHIEKYIYIYIYIYMYKIQYYGFPFPHEYSGEGRGAYHQGRYLSTNAEKETRYNHYGQLLLFQ
jgi:hypothetical protein